MASFGLGQFKRRQPLPWVGNDRSANMDTYKGFTHLGREQDQAPRLGLLYLAVIPFLAGLGLVAWLGWGWQALVLTALVAGIFVGAVVVRRTSNRGSRSRRGGDTPSAHHSHARTKTVEHQTRMHLDSKGPLGF